MPVKAGQHAEDDPPSSLQASPLLEEYYVEDQDYLQDELLAQEVVDEAEHHLTWHKELDAPDEPKDILFPPRPSQMYPVVLKPLPPQKTSQKQRVQLTPLLWTRLLAAGILLLIVVFGIFFTVGRNFLNVSPSPHEPTLQASSSSVAPGATLTLHGSNFSPNGVIALSRDATIPIVDTRYLTRISADSKGNFTDTITISAVWQSGIHTMNAEDAVLHKTARFPIFVTGHNTALRPAYLNISTATIDMGAGDFATHSTQQITLSNLGGGQITWQGRTDQPWLQITPKQGTIADIAKVQVTVAVDRSQLKLGSYTAHLNFISDAGSGSISVKMSVIPLNAGQDAVLDVSPAVLAFTATDGGSPPPSQTVTISNLGVRALSWNAMTGASWLSVSPQSGMLQKAPLSTGGLMTSTPVGTTQTVRVSINTSTLLPGTYNSVITFSSQGQVKDSPQSITVTITINPQCVLQVAPAMLSFASAYGQATPANQNISVNVSQGCTKTMAWSAASGSQWLQLNTTSGTTPTHPTVSINDIGLKPGGYNSSIIFTTAAGTDTVPVTFTLGQPTDPVMNVSTNALTYNAVVGQGNPPPQNIVITNSAGGTLNWQASFVATTGGNWLNISPASGSLATHQSVSVSVKALLNGLPPYPYSGAITISGTDGAGHTAAGSAKMVQVSFNVQAACAVSVAQGSLSFSGILGQANPTPQSLTITASGACAHQIAWSVTSDATWLSATPNGMVTPTTPANSSVSVSLNGLHSIPYSSSVTLTASDSVTNQAIGSPIHIPVNFQVNPACTLGTPSTNALNFSTEAGQSPPPQTFSISVSGTCNGNVTVTPNISMTNGTGWLSVSPTSAPIPSGGSATFTVTVTGTTLSATDSPYNGSIALNASNGGGAIVGSPQNVGVAVAVAAAPALSASAGAAMTHGTNGLTSQSVDIANTGGTPLNWSATLNGAPAFVGLSSGSGTLAAGGTDATNVIVTDAAGVVSGDYSASVTLTATDAATGTVIAGSPTTVPITISVAFPSMQLNTSTLNYSTTDGTDPNTQTLTITNSGGATLTWTAGTPSDSWVTLDSTSGSDESNISSTVTFSIHTAGLTAGTPYSATVLITPSYGPAVPVTINLTIDPFALSPTPTINITTSPTPTIAPTPSSTKSSTLL